MSVANTAGFFKRSHHSKLDFFYKKAHPFSVFSVSQISYDSICENQDKPVFPEEIRYFMGFSPLHVVVWLGGQSHVSL